MACSGCSQQMQGGIGQTPSSTTTTTPTSKPWLPWVIGGAVVVAVGGIAAYAMKKPHGFAREEENPTRKKTPGAYRDAIAVRLMHQYGFSQEKAHAAVNDDEIAWKIAYLFSHNYNVAYATKRIHRAARRKYYGPWKEAGYMPLYKPLPPMSGGTAIPAAAEYF